VGGEGVGAGAGVGMSPKTKVAQDKTMCLLIDTIV